MTYIFEILTDKSFVRHLYIFIILSSFFALQAEAQNVCVNDRSGAKGAANQDINKSVDEAKDPLTKAFLAQRTSPSQASGYCATCATGGQSTPASSLASRMKDIVAHESKGNSIRKDCIEASLQRSPGNRGYSCYSKKKGSFDNSGSTTPCLNQKTVDLVHFAMNEAISCMSSGRNPIDARFIFKKINNETAFNFYVAYGGGKGIGQLTSDAVNEIAGWNEGGKFMQGNAFYILEDLMKSDNPACAPFKEILKDDLKSPPPSPGNARNNCTWVAPGAGLARNLIYGLGYYIHMRDQVIRPYLQRKAPKLAQNRETLSYLTLVAYGPGGMREAKSLIDRLRLSNSSIASDVKNKIVSKNTYVRNTESKMKEFVQIYQPEDATPADFRGDTCME